MERKLVNMKTLSLISLILTLLFVCQSSFAQSGYGELELQNDSKRDLIIKIMYADGGKHSDMEVAPGKMEKVTFTDSLSYYLKVKATMADQEPMYWSDGDYQFYDGGKGWTIATFTYEIDEKSKYASIVGKVITEEEFEKDDK